jgi:GntR family transcriptional repressor for pyruvate dehydrogenase complex
MSKHAAATPFKIAALKHRRVYESVAEQIRQAIFSGQLATGHKLPPERDMARQFQTSRVALREALRALEQEGMISIKRGFGGGAFVADFDAALKALADSLHTVVKLGQAKSGHLTEARTILEPELARLATSRADEADLKAMQALVEAQEKDLRSGVLTRKHDIEFHTLVANACHNPVLTIVISAIDEAIRDAILRSKLTREMRAGVVGYHRSLFDAISARDEERAYTIMKEHVAAVQKHLRESEENGVGSKTRRAGRS